MYENILICEKEKTIGELSSKEIAAAIRYDPDSAGNSSEKEEYESVMEYLKKNSKEQGKIVVDLSELLKGKKTEKDRVNAVFWTAYAMKDNGLIKEFSPKTLLKLIPFLTVKAKEYEQMMKNDAPEGLETMMKFTSLCTEAFGQISDEDETGAKNAAEKIYNALPPVDVMRKELEERPNILNVIRSVKELGESCPDPELQKKMGDYFGQLSDLM